MLELHEEKLKKTEGLKRFDGEYKDDNDRDSEGKPKNKPFVPTFLRYKNELNCSKWVKKDSRVQNIRTDIEAELSAGDQIMDEMRQKLAASPRRLQSWK